MKYHPYAGKTTLHATTSRNKIKQTADLSNWFPKNKQTDKPNQIHFSKRK